MGQEAKAGLSTADRWLLFGNLMTILGTCAVGVGSVLKLTAGPGLPSGRPVFAGGGTTVETPHTQLSGRDAMRDYFST